jgi:hypothetical protein
MTNRTASLVLLAAAAFCLQGAFAADTPMQPAARAAKPASDNMAQARAAIAAKQWPAALEALQRADDPASAEWHNLMGFVLRKGPTPDLAGSETHYDEALRIDPHHRDTLEYSGELYLMKGELDKSQARLATLSSECAASCTQYSQLKSAIERYKLAGNKFVAADW